MDDWLLLFAIVEEIVRRAPQWFLLLELQGLADRRMMLALDMRLANRVLGER